MKKFAFTLILLAFFCEKNLSQQTIEVFINSTQPSLLQALAGIDVGISGGSITIGDSPAAVGGVIPYSYEWSPGSGLDDVSIANPTFSGSESQEYTLVVNDARGCISFDTVSVSIITVLPNFNKDDGLLVYPNPSDGILKLRLNKGKDFINQTVKLNAANGQIVASTIWKNKEELIIELTGLQTGNYTLVIGEGATKVSRNVIIKK